MSNPKKNKNIPVSGELRRALLEDTSDTSSSTGLMSMIALGVSILAVIVAGSIFVVPLFSAPEEPTPVPTEDMIQVTISAFDARIGQLELEATQQILALTEAARPTETPLPTNTPSPTITPTPTVTPEPEMTNEAETTQESEAESTEEATSDDGVENIETDTVDNAEVAPEPYSWVIVSTCVNGCNVRDLAGSQGNAVGRVVVGETINVFGYTDGEDNSADNFIGWLQISYIDELTGELVEGFIWVGDIPAVIVENTVNLDE